MLIRICFHLIVSTILFVGASYAQCLDPSPSGDCDQDGIINGLDSDADNDGILDLFECQDLIEESFQSSNGISVSFVFPAATTGIFIDLYALDNSFEININGTDLVNDELQFESAPSTASDSDMIYASDGTRHGRNGNPQVWNIGGGPGDPIVRIKLSGDGQILILGKRNTNSALEELIVQPGDPQINNITWNQNMSNTVTINQEVVGPTYIEGQIFGLDCDNDTDRDGTPDYLDLDSDNDLCPDAIEGDENLVISDLLSSTAIDDGVDECGIPLIVAPQGQGIGISTDANQFSDYCVIFEVETFSPSCIGKDDGYAIINVLNSTSNYIFELLPGQLVQSTNTYNMLAAGSYTLLISNPNSSFETSILFTIEPSIYECLTCETLAMPYDCPSAVPGSINVIPSGGLPQYCFSINGGQIQKDGLFEGLNEGSYVVEISDDSGQSVNCLEEVQLIELPVIDYSDILCFGDSVKVGSKIYFASGTYTDTLTSVVGCDSILNSDLQFLDLISANQSINLCEGDTLEIGSKNYTLSGIYIDTLQSLLGCDSIVNTDLQFFDLPIINQVIKLCQGDSLEIEDSTYLSTGLYSDTLTSINGCDSIVNTDLFFLTHSELFQSFELCDGDVLPVGTSNYTISGDYEDVLVNAQGCDSLIYTSVEFINQINFTQEANLCPDEAIAVGINTYTTSGIYIDTLMAFSGCDSIVRTIVRNLVSSDSFQSIELCSGDSLSVGSSYYNSSGNYSDIIENINGCDSLIQTELFIIDNAFIDQSLELCVSDSIIVGSSVYQETGTYVDTLTSINGCDSIINTFITVLDIEQRMESFTICRGDSIENEMGLFFDPGIYTFLIEEDNDCDYELTINIDLEDDVICQSKNCISFIPNVFSPDSDGVNDVFQAFSEDITFNELIIFDRWGNKLFESNEINPVWDGFYNGTKLMPSVYVYLIRGVCRNGDEVFFADDITLIR